MTVLRDRLIKSSLVRSWMAATICVLLLLASLAPSLSVWAEDTNGSDEQTTYTNSETGYKAVIVDEAGLLTEGEKKSLLEDMTPVTDYGNALFYTIDRNKGTTIYVGRDKLEELFGPSPNGTVFIIDMANRELSVYSDGAIYKTITRAKSSSIVSNVYRMATDKKYYECASEVFKEISASLKGAKIAEPMKLASNILLAIMLGLLIAYWIVKAFSIVPKPSEKELLAAIQTKQELLDYHKAFTHQTRRYDPPRSSASSGGGGGGGSGGGGGGGGASHGF